MDFYAEPRVETSVLFALNCLWVGETLRPLEQVSLLSMVRQGHRVRLFTYGKVKNVPDGIEVEDANAVLPWEQMLFHRATNSPALGANVFRYHMMRAGLGLWLDLDVLLLKPIVRTSEPLFGFQDSRLINNAVLFLPPDSPVLDDLIDFTGRRYPVPPFYSPRKKIRLTLRKCVGRPVHVSDLKWGVFGPHALTHFVRKHALADKAAQREVYYPVHPADAHSLFLADGGVEDMLGDETVAIHMWNELLRQPSPRRPDNPPGSLLVDKGSFVETFARKELGFTLQGECP